MEQLQSHIWLTAPHIWGNICAFPHILGSPSSYRTLQLLHSEFPYIWGKLDFLFYQCNYYSQYIHICLEEQDAELSRQLVEKQAVEESVVLLSPGARRSILARSSDSFWLASGGSCWMFDSWCAATRDSPGEVLPPLSRRWEPLSPPWRACRQLKKQNFLSAKFLRTRPPGWLAGRKGGSLTALSAGRGIWCASSMLCVLTRGHHMWRMEMMFKQRSLYETRVILF